MKANRPGISRASGALVALLALLSGCVEPVQAPIAPLPVQRLPPPPAPRSPGAVDWHDLPATPGIWWWSRAGSTTIARFGFPDQRAVFSMICDRSSATITMVRSDAPGPGVDMTIRTTTLTRTLPAQSAIFGMTAALSARDPLLDAMAFSRGRFAVLVPGSTPLYLPSWPEVSRVIEDCR